MWNRFQLLDGAFNKVYGVFIRILNISDLECEGNYTITYLRNLKFCFPISENFSRSVI